MKVLSGQSRNLSLRLAATAALMVVSMVSLAQTTKPVPPARPAAKPAVVAAKPAVLAAKPVAPAVKPASPVLTRPAVATTPVNNAARAVAPVAAAPAAVAAPAATSAATMTGSSATPRSAILGGATTAGSSANTSNLSTGNYSGGSNLAQVASSETGSRSAGFANGLGTFRYGSITLTAFGCFRSNSRVFCDFDVSDEQSHQINLGDWRNVSLILDGGRIVNRHNAFFLGQDGTQFSTAATSPGNPVRYVMEYDDIGTSFSSVTVANGGDRISSVGITVMDANQAPGTVPARGAAATTATASSDPNAQAAPGSTNAIDKASSAVSTATGNVTKAKGFWKQVQQSTQTH